MMNNVKLSTTRVNFAGSSHIYIPSSFGDKNGCNKIEEIVMV